MSRIQLDELSILLIEPSVTQRRIIEARLAEVGNQNVESVDSPEGAWEAMQKFPPDLVISSMYFDHGTGSELLSKMRGDEKLKEVPFVLISSEYRWEYLEPVKQAGVMAILPKPFRVEDLKLALTATLDFMEPEELEGEEIDPESIRVLVVDDSITARKHISKLLQNMGVERIFQARDGVEAIEIMDDTIFDIVITDFNMPEMDGERLTNYIRNHSSQSSVPIMMVTSENDEARLDTVMKSGVSAICDKPFNATQIRSLLGQLLH